MYRDLWTLGLPMLAGATIAIALGVSLDWSNGTLGWAIIGGCALVQTIWGLARPRRQEH